MWKNIRLGVRVGRGGGPLGKISYGKSPQSRQLHSNAISILHTYTCTYIQGVTLRLKPFHLRGFQLIVLIFILSAGFLFFCTKNRNLSKGNTRHSAVLTLSRVSEGSCKGNTWKCSIFQGLYSVLIINVSCWHCRSTMESLFPVGIRAKEEGETENSEEE